MKRDFKVWVCADSMNDYALQLDIYTRKSQTNSEVGLDIILWKKLTKK